MNQAEQFTQSIESMYWDAPDYSIKTHGPGGKPAIEAFPFQGLDVATRPYEPDWSLAFERLRSLNAKYVGQFTPLGTPVAELVRTGGEALVSPCGNCGVQIGRCRCSFAGASE